MDPRYEHPPIRTIWNRAQQLLLWYRVECAWMDQLNVKGRAQVELEFPAEAFDVNEHAEYERRHRHEFVAFLCQWTDKLPKDAQEARRWLHYGLTSSDVIDTATAIQLRYTNQTLDGLINGLKEALFSAAERVAGLEQVGRTHGQWAEPRSAQTPLRALDTALRRQQHRLDGAAHDLLLADFSGPTGGRDGLDDSAVRNALNQLGLRRAPGSTQIVPRDSLAHWGHAVAGLTTICAAIADHYWMLAQSGIGEVRVAGGSPSSAMPHKNNPHDAENVIGLARLARGLASTLDESIVQRGDRDLAHSSVERVAVPDLAHLAATALTRTARLVQEWRYEEIAVRDNLNEAVANGARSSQAVRAMVQRGSTRDQAHEEWHKLTYQSGTVVRSADGPNAG